MMTDCGVARHGLLEDSVIRAGDVLDAYYCL